MLYKIKTYFLYKLYKTLISKRKRQYCTYFYSIPSIVVREYFPIACERLLFKHFIVLYKVHSIDLFLTFSGEIIRSK